MNCGQLPKTNLHEYAEHRVTAIILDTTKYSLFRPNYSDLLSTDVNTHFIKLNFINKGIDLVNYFIKLNFISKGIVAASEFTINSEKQVSQ